MMSTNLLRALSDNWQGLSFSHLPTWYRDRQRRALENARASDWPTRASETWRYTSLHALAQLSLVPASAGIPRDKVWSEPVTHGLTFVDGAVATAPQVGLPAGVALETLSNALSDDSDVLRFVIGRESEAGDVFEYLNTAFAHDGAWLRADGGVVDEQWLTLRSRSSTAMVGQTWHLAHRIDLGAGARLRIVVENDADIDASGLTTVMSRIRLQRDAQLDLVWIAHPAANVAAIARTHIDMEQGATLRMHVLDGGAAPSRHDLRVALRGSGARVQLGGAFLLDDRRHADVQLDLRHDAPATRSETLWRAIAADRSRAVFNGHITVAAGADGTDAQLGCKSLLGSVHAEIDVKPVLEIHADDVKCAHGATVGQLDEQALFYLRTRGLDEVSARALLTRAFAAEALSGIEGSLALSTLETWLGSGSG